MSSQLHDATHNTKPHKTMSTTSTIALPLTITSNYHDDTKVTRSTNPKTLRKLISDFRRGEGDWIHITDADGVGYDLTDLGHGVELVRNGTYSN